MTKTTCNYYPSIVMESYLDFSCCHYFDYNIIKTSINMTIGNYMTMNCDYTINIHVEYS